ncbi:MAG TPA: FAD-dependent oxidoreductase [Aestuariivirga sp.]|nr:FAD-dependent oxidoreductase [Aestuariivirga sp.]
MGTGISGALVADALMQAGYSVLAVDRREPMSGSTPASTALLQFELDTPLTELSRKIGKSNAARAWWRSVQAVQALQQRIETLQIRCGLAERSTIYLPGNILGTRQLKLEAAARQKLGLRSEFISRQHLHALTGMEKPGAILSHGNGEADPVRLVAGLWRHFLARGGRMAANIEVTEVKQTRNRVRLKTKDGHSISARYAVFCTGYELMKFARPKGYKVISTWALATRPQPGRIWPTKSLIWEASDPYLYLRTTGEGRVIVGGEDESFSDDVLRDKLIPKKIAAIARKAKRIFPHIDFTADYGWTGSFGESPTGLPAIGPVRDLPRCYAVLGFGGNGITFSMLAAQLISRHIQGIKDPDAEIFKL